MKRALPAALGLLLPLFGAGPAAADDLWRSVPAQAGGSLRVDLDGGSVEVVGHAEPSVRVSARTAGLGSRSFDFDLQSQGREVRLSGDLSGWLGMLDPTVRVRVRVPSRFDVEVRTSGGDVVVEDLEGAVTLRTSGGAVEVHHVRGPVELRTSGGEVRAAAVRGDLEARTSGGRIHASEVEGAVDARTSGGPIQIYDVSGSVEARTSGGPIAVRFTRPPRGRLETSGGGIDVEFPAGSGVDLDARSSGGRVEVDPRVAVRGSSEAGRVEGAIHGGGGELRLRTSGGSIHVRER